MLVFYNICRKDSSVVSSELLKYHIIAHNMGGEVDSKEGFENAYTRGTRLFDADLRFSKDGELILCHEWDGLIGYFSFSKEDIYYNDLKVGQVERSLLPSKEEYCQTKIDNKYTMISFADVVEYMKEWGDIYIVCDAKEDVEETYSTICKTADYSPDVLNRIVVSLYREEDFDIVKSIYPFKHFAIRQYENLPRSADEIINICKEKQINIVNVGTAYCDRDTIKAYKKNGLFVYAAVVNDISYFDMLRENGVHGIVSDFIYEDMMDAK
ncbi:hypothetical protein CBFG_05808 [Clostridiales bacterium 1_7_47FAA]|uniref:Glycerophosphodiester phosphodiesterase family protein n=1 Tax=Enterocloster hominis (ex Hitch et al. 2024) TaxID=1917870 RepID=A0ABV1DB24_9FIRM|nr:hypothetical protein CBFG_05808 [Clostridiales bacterium 1_7_47FAA]